MSRFDGMTTNERLFEAGVINAWDAAFARRDRNEMIVLLGMAGLSDQAASIADQALKNSNGPR